MESKVIESYHPQPKQLEFHKATQAFKAFIGGFGSGKTKTGCQECIDLGVRYPGNRIAILRDTMPDLKDSTMASFFEECPEELIYTYRRNDQRVILTTGTEIIFRSFRQYKNSPRNQFESKIKSLNLGAFYVDEGNEITKNEFLLLQGRLRLDSVPKHFGFLTSNPPNRDHWIYELFASEKADRSKYFLVQASSKDNKFLPPGYVENLCKEYPPSWVKKFVDGEFGFMTVGEPMYEGYDDDFHSKDTKYMPHRPVHRYWDFGWHRPAVLWAQIDVEGRWIVHRELMGYNISIHNFVPKIFEISNEHFPGAAFTDYCDPAGKQETDKGSTIRILKDDFGIQMRHRFSFVSDGIDIVQKKLMLVIKKEPALQVNRTNCPILISGFQGGYASAKASDGRGMGVRSPLKDGYFEHLHDALRYGAINIFSSNSGETERSRDFTIGGPSYGVATGGGSVDRLVASPETGWAEVDRYR